MVDHQRGRRTSTSSADQPLAHKLPDRFNRRRIGSWLRHKSSHSASSGMGKHGGVFLFFGVILPLIALVFELTTHFCAQHFFDPFPSANHVVLFLLIPLSNFMAWLAGRRDMSQHYGFMCLISGMAMGIGCLYALMFLPLTPNAAMYTLLFGFGLLGFAPILSIPCSWLSGKSVCRLASSRKTFFDPHQVEHIGHLIVLCLVVAVELPSTLTRMNLSLAANPATEVQGVEWLRKFGSEEVMLRACYERSGRATDILGSLYESGHPLSIESARSIFYKVTGKPFNSVAIPSSARATIQHAGLIDDPAGLNANVKDEFDLDADIAGENVSGVARGLSISYAKIVGTVNADAAVADFDWSMTLNNSSQIDREARAKLQLPPDSVVTKATITINGVERDATILVRSLARQIYQNAVVERKDPLLVSTCGVNQILIQCYPVKPNTPVIVRLHIAAPLVISSDKKIAALQMPAFAERNFQFDQPIKVVLASNASFTIAGKKQPETSLHDGVYESGSLEPAQLARFAGVAKFSRDPGLKEAIAPDSFAKDGTSIVRTVAPVTYKLPEQLTVVVDGSAPMERYMPEIAAGLTHIPATVATTIVIVGDRLSTIADNDRGSRATIFGAIEKYHPVGGHANDDQVLRALDKGPVLWIHAAQPVSTIESPVVAKPPSAQDVNPLAI